jgi:hypothetical protein
MAMAQGQTVRCAVIVLAGALAASSAADFSQAYANRGQMIVRPFASAPFPHPDRVSGHKYQGETYSAAEHYTDSTVAIFVPRGYRPQERADFIVHFHGWRNHIEKVFLKYELADQLVASGRNAILVVPQGPYDAPDSFGGKLEDAGGFKRFMEEVIAKLRQEGGAEFGRVQAGRIILSGHSGGYHVMSAIVDHGGLSDQIREVWLFDALYGQTEKFLAWADREKGRFVDLYTDHGGTKEETEALIRTLKSRGSDFLSINESEATSVELKKHRVVFLHTDLEHDEVVQKRQAFREFLETSCLEPIQLKD